MHIEHPTFQQVIHYLSQCMKKHGVPTKGVRIPYTDEAIINRARIALQDPMRELVFHKISSTCYAPSVEIL